MSILIVNVEKHNRDALAHILNAEGSSQLLIAKNVKHAARILSDKKTAVRFVITDDASALAEGAELFLLLNSSPILEVAPLVMVSSELSEHEIRLVQVQNPRIDGTLRIPFRASRLLEAMNAASAVRASRRETLLVYSETEDDGSVGKIREVIDKKDHGGHWRQVIHVSTQRELETQLEKQRARIGAILVDPDHYEKTNSKSKQDWLSKLRKDPVGSSVVICCLGIRPGVAKSLRTFCDVFVQEEELNQVPALLERVSHKAQNRWIIAKSLEKIRAHMRAKAYGVALGLVKRVVSLDPLSDEGHAILGLIHQQEGRLKAARQDYRRALELNPFFAQPYLKLLDIVEHEQASDRYGLAERAALFCPNHLHVLRAAFKVWDASENVDKCAELGRRISDLEKMGEA